MKNSANLRSLLVVDCHARDTSLIQECLAAFGDTYSGYFCLDRLEAQEYVEYVYSRTNLRRPDLIVIDLDEEDNGRSGLELLKYLKSSSYTCGVPVVVWSTMSDPDLINETYNEHTNAYLIKPESDEQMKTMIRELLTYWLEVVRLAQPL